MSDVADVDADDEVETIADLALRHGLHIAVAESLTSGAIASRLGAGPNAAEWFRGGVVAYGEAVKFDLLDVTPGPLVTERCAQQMAKGVAGLLAADATVAATGVGGPDPDEGKPAGTVVLAVFAGGVGSCRHLSLPGDPEDVIEGTVREAVRMLARALTNHAQREGHMTRSSDHDDSTGQVSEVGSLDPEGAGDPIAPGDATAGYPESESDDPQEGTAGPDAPPRHGRPDSSNESSR